MTVTQGRFGAGVVLALLVAAGCGRSATPGTPDDDTGSGAGGQGGEVPDTVTAASGEGGVGGAVLGGEGGVKADGGASGSTATAGEPATIGGAGSDSCAPGERVCDGSSVRVCDASAHSTIQTTCSASEVCSEGNCKAIACVPHHQFCEAGIVRLCSGDGTASTQQDKCGANEFCLEHDGSAECSQQACVPSEPMCLDNVATVCKASGDAPQAGGQDCAKKGQLCQEGACIVPSCEAGKKLCEGGDVHLCIGNGTSTVLFTDCTTDEVCDPNQLACRPRVCEPGKLGCDSTRIVKCNELGTGWDQAGKDCETSGQSCSAGKCADRVCVPGSTFCQSGAVYQCDQLGLTSSLSDSCWAYYYHCAAYPNDPNKAYCAYNTCSPNSGMCNGNVATVCNADGTGMVAGGTDCGANAICRQGVCQAKICNGNAYFCANDNVAACSDSTYSYTVTDCPDDAPCGATAGGIGVACVPYKCWPGLKSCVGNQLGTCAADGSALSSVKQDCSATDEVCVSASACGQSAVDAVGAPEELASVANDQVFGDVIEVGSNRKLTQLEANLVLAGPRNLRWVVYEVVNGYFVSSFDVVVNSAAGSGYFSSGAINYTLKAGKRYMLGVAVSGGGVAPYYDSRPWQPEVSFGIVRGSQVTTYATTLYDYGDAVAVYDLRITTELP